MGAAQIVSKTAEHTPGPWEYVPATEHHGPYVTGPFGGDICDCYAMSNPAAASVLNGGTSKPIQFQDAEANARLIAAAPDGLELAEDALPILEAVLDDRETINGEEDEILRDLISRTKAFIVSARSGDK